MANQKNVSIQVIRKIKDLESLISQWSTLAQEAEDANVFYEPWLLLPALDNFHQDGHFQFLIMHIVNPQKAKDPPLLCGFFPLEEVNNYKGIPCKVLRLINTHYSRLSTPLVHRFFVSECIGAFLDWLETSSNSCSLIELNFITGEGRVAQEFHQQITERKWVSFQYEYTIRALLKPYEDANTYLKLALSAKHIREFGRLERKLSSFGPTTYRFLEANEDHKPWTEAFLNLESQGWKGKNKTSLASETKSKNFFEEFTTQAHRKGQLMMLGLFHQNKPIALKCNILSGKGAFAFKIAYDEDYANYSPGMLLELENIRYFHRLSKISWMDSTAESNHPMINRLWLDRRSIETLIFSPNRVWGNCILSLFPLLRGIKTSLKQGFKRKRPYHLDSERRLYD